MYHPTSLQIVTIVVVLAVAVYLNSLSGQFVYDDLPAVVNNRDILPQVPIADVFKHDYWGADITHERSHKSYRPFTILTFRLNYLLHALNPVGYHVVNVGLHAATSAIFYHLLTHVIPSSSAPFGSPLDGSLFPFFAAASFALHPIHTESVANVAGRAEVLAGLFFVSAMLLYTRAVRCASTRARSLFFLLAFLVGLLCILSKEIGFTLPLVLIALELSIFHGVFRVPLPRVILRSAVLLVIGLAFALGRWRIFGASSEALVSVFAVDNRALTQPWAVRTLTWLYLPVYNFLLLLFPARLSHDYGYECIPFVASLSDPRTILSAGFYSVLAVTGLCALWKLFPRGGAASSAVPPPPPYWGVLVLGLGWMVLAFLPATNLLVPVGFVVAERVLYTPSFGFSVLTGLLFAYLRRSKPRLCIVLALLVCAGYSAKTLERNSAWSDDARLWRSAMEVCPTSARVLFSYAGTMLNAQDYHGALPLLQRALAIDPNEHTIHMMLAKCYRETGGSAPLALTHAARALVLQPRIPGVHSFVREIIVHYMPELVKQADPVRLSVPGLILAVGEHLLNPDLVATALAFDPTLAGHFYTGQIARAIDLAARSNTPPVPTSWTAPRGIVMCAGRLQYLTAAYVTLHMLRETGCQLPVELWYNGPAEMPPGAEAWFSGVSNLRLVDASKLVAGDHNLSGYQIKAFAIVHSGFREVMLLDADNVPIRDVAGLFEESAYRNTGALFWPDYCGIQTISRELWGLMGLEPPLAEAEFPEAPYYKKGGCSDPRYENEFESGQLIVDKSRHWPALQAVLYMNTHHNYFYNHMYGDKDTFRLAFNAARARFHLVRHPFTVYGQLLSEPKGAAPARMCGVGVFGQRHPTSGEVVFVHNYKWNPAQLVQAGYGDLLKVAADSYSSLSMKKGCGPLAFTRCNAPKDPVVRSLVGREATFERRGRQLLRQLWDTPTYRNHYCASHPTDCQAIQQGLSRSGKTSISNVALQTAR